jgi:hypothetical protein
MNPDTAAIQCAAEQFQFEGGYIRAEQYGSGHINNTYAVYFGKNGGQHRYILQQINKSVFTKPIELMENVERVTQHLRRAIKDRNGNPDRESLTLIPALDGTFWHQDPDGEFWRAYLFIENTVCLQMAEKTAHLYNAARAFGKFQMLLSDFPTNLLYETIPDFHHTNKRFRDFLATIEKNSYGRVSAVQPEVEFVLRRESDTTVLLDAIESGKLPLRVTHNDTKLNNVMRRCMRN